MDYAFYSPESSPIPTSLSKKIVFYKREYLLALSEALRPTIAAGRESQQEWCHQSFQESKRKADAKFVAKDSESDDVEQFASEEQSKSVPSFLFHLLVYRGLSMRTYPIMCCHP